MSMNNNNNNNPPNRLGGASLGNAGAMMGSARPVFGQWQSQYGSGFQNPYLLSQAQAVARAQAAQAQARAQAQAAMQAQAANAQYQVHLQGQGGVGLNVQQSSAFGGYGKGSTNFSSSGVDARRFNQKPPTVPQGALAYAPSQSNRMELTPVAGRMMQKNLDTQSNKKVAALLPKSTFYTQLLDFENRIDAELMKKKHDIQEASRNPPCNQKILRIYIFNTFSNQTQPTLEKKDDEPPTWTLRVTGRILEDGEDPNQPETAHKPKASYPKFSSFFKKVTIKLDEQVYPDNNTIVWEQVRSVGAHDGFEVKRKGVQEFNARIKLEMNYAPKKFKLSPHLSALLGFEFESRPRILAAVWRYIKGNNLKDRDDNTMFLCDLPLQRVFGQHKMSFTMLSQKISPHLSPPSPIDIDHRVKLSGSSPAVNACYDVLVDLPYPIQKDLDTIVEKSVKADEIKAFDNLITDALLKIQEHHKRRALFLGFSQSPIEFIESFIESHSRDLNTIAGESSSNPVKKHVSESYNQPWYVMQSIRCATCRFVMTV